VRETDSVLPLSAHEYLLVLPFTNQQGTTIVLENVGLAFTKLLQRKDCSNLTLLASSATYPQDGAGSREIIAILEAQFKQQLVAAVQVATTIV